MNEPFSSGNRNLVIVRAGRKSLHSSWMAGAEQPRFDLLVAAYEDGVPVLGRPDVGIVRVPGRKVAGLSRVLAKYSAIVQSYSRVALFDDDLATNAAAINRLFDIGERFGLEIWQPSLTPDSYFSYAVFLQNRAFELRFTNFIEIMCPVFTAETLRKLQPLFGLGLEVGVDLLWCRCFDMPWFKCAVIDAVAVMHTRPVGSTAARQGFSDGRRYDHEMAEALEMFGATFYGPVVYAGLTPGGRLIARPEHIALKALSQLSHWGKTPMGKQRFLRLVTDHVRHCLTRPVNLGKVDRLDELTAGGMPSLPAVPIQRLKRKHG
jgi:hypothetical protein